MTENNYLLDLLVLITLVVLGFILIKVNKKYNMGNPLSCCLNQNETYQSEMQNRQIKRKQQEIALANRKLESQFNLYQKEKEMFQESKKRQALLQRQLDEANSKIDSLQREKKLLGNNQSQNYQETKKLNLMYQSAINEKNRIERNLQSTLSQLQNSKNRCKTQQEQMTRMIDQKQADQTKFGNTIRNLQIKVAEQNRLLERMAKDSEISNKIRQEFNTLRQEKEELEKKLSYQKNLSNKENERSYNYEQQLRENQIKINSLKSECQQSQQRLQQITKQLNNLRQAKSVSQPTTNLDQRGDTINRSAALFCGRMLDSDEDYKQYLMSILQRKKGRIARTELLYRFDKLNTVNFHNYFDNKQNIVVIIKTSAANGGYVFGGWSEGPFIFGKPSDKSGLIFSLSNRRYFQTVTPNKKAITYDQFFMIIGNSEIRLKSLQQKVFSNFGIGNGYYASKGQKVGILLGSDESREIDIEGYEIFQVFFK